jgi:diguanylate cyclase (GGDEF)-like protein
MNEGRDRLSTTLASSSVARRGSAFETRHSSTSPVDNRFNDQFGNADHDPLTGLPNGRVLARFLKRALDDRRTDHRVGLLVMDIDRFATVNDSLGRCSGDDLLKQIADRGRRIVRSSDLFARRGRDEFVFAWCDADEHAYVGLSRRVLAAMEPTFRIGAVDLSVTVTLGEALSDRSSTADTMVAEADRVIYVRKAARHRSAGNTERRSVGVVASDSGRSGSSAASASATSPVALSGCGESSLPTMIFGRDDGRLCHSNDAASALLGEPAATLVGRPVASLFQACSAGTDLALDALSAGSIDSFRARRSLIVGDRVVPTWVQVRTMSLHIGTVAVWTLLPDDGRAINAELSASFWLGAVPSGLGLQQTDVRASAGVVSHERIAEMELHLENLSQAIRAVAADVAGAAGDVALQVVPQPESVDWSRLAGLSERQRDVVRRLVHGERVPAIATAMYLSSSTVRNHLSAAFRHFGVNSQSDLVQLFRPSQQSRPRLAS